MANIYELSNEMQDIYDKLESGEGIDLETGELKPEIVNALCVKKNELETKVVDYGYVIKTFDDNIDVYDKEIKRLQERKAQMVNTREKMKEVISKVMQDFEITEIKGKTIKISFRDSESVEVFDERLLTSEFIRSKFEPDKVAIKEALKNGQDVQGARLTKKKNLQIK